MYRRPKRPPFLVFKRIREAILDEVFKPGDHLGEAELAERFEVSRSPVRETLLALEKKGTLVISPYRGAVVRPLSGEEILDIAELRLPSSLWPLNQRTVIFPQRTSTMPMTWRSAWRVCAAPRSTSNATAVFGASFYQSPTTNFRRSVPTSGGPRHSVRANFDEAFPPETNTVSERF
jgi:hypothetical protein